MVQWCVISKFSSHYLELTWTQEAAVLRGQRETEFYSYESIALVRAVGSKATGVEPGDRVLVLKPGKFGSSFAIHQDFCHTLLPHDNITDLSGVIFRLCSALFLLNDLTSARNNTVCLQS